MTATMPHVYPTVLHMVAAAAAAVPERLALQCGTETLSYRDYAACIAGFAGFAAELGPDMRGARVAVLMGNSLDAAIATIAMFTSPAKLSAISTSRLE
jgi:acyl-CoA synthetase (AMP-forming)/AMP-acid ligase II